MISALPNSGESVPQATHINLTEETVDEHHLNAEVENHLTLSQSDDNPPQPPPPYQIVTNDDADAISSYVSQGENDQPTRQGLASPEQSSTPQIQTRNKTDGNEVRHSSRERKNNKRGHTGLRAAVSQGDIRGISNNTHFISAAGQTPTTPP